MIRVILFLAACLAAATGLSWLADKKGALTIQFDNFVIETSVFNAVVVAALSLAAAALIVSLVRQLWNSPWRVANFMNRRRQQHGLDSLSAGMIAIGAGDHQAATKYGIQARKALPHEPMTHLLRAQAAQMSGDAATSRRIYEAMLASPDTEQLGLRGLFVEAQREKEPEAARQYAARALKLNSKLGWASDALFDIQCRSGDYEGALETLAIARRNNHIDKAVADRREAVLLTGQAQQCEDSDPMKALTLATKAHGLAPDLIQAASMAGRMLASRGNTGKAAKILQKTWALAPHPDLATAYAFARIGDSPRDRLARLKQLAALNPNAIESAIAVANGAIDAQDFGTARKALEPMTDGRLTQQVATLMARIESEQHGDKGRIREWLARAVNAERDAVWTADGVVADQWAPVSPVTGQLDAFQWRVPVAMVGASDTELLARKVEELVALSAPAAIEPPVIEATVAPAQSVRADPARGNAPTGRPEATITKPVAVQPMPGPKSAAIPTAGKPSTPVRPVEAAAPVIDVVASKPAPTAVKTATAQPNTKDATSGKTGKKPEPTGKEPRVFVVPRAPDDPGPDAETEGQPTGSRPPYRAVP